MQVLVSQITTWMATYLNDHLEPWIQDNGSWDTFVELFLWKQYSNPEPQGPRVLQPLVPDGDDCGWYGSAGLDLQLIVTIPFVIVIHSLYKLTFLFLLL